MIMGLQPERLIDTPVVRERGGFSDRSADMGLLKNISTGWVFGPQATDRRDGPVLLPRRDGSEGARNTAVCEQQTARLAHVSHPRIGGSQSGSDRENPALPLGIRKLLLPGDLFAAIQTPGSAG